MVRFVTLFVVFNRVSFLGMVDLELYRARIGSFCGGSNVKKKKGWRGVAIGWKDYNGLAMFCGFLLLCAVFDCATRTTTSGFSGLGGSVSTGATISNGINGTQGDYFVLAEGTPPGSTSISALMSGGEKAFGRDSRSNLYDRPLKGSSMSIEAGGCVAADQSEARVCSTDVSGDVAADVTAEVGGTRTKTTTNLGETIEWLKLHPRKVLIRFSPHQRLARQQFESFLVRFQSQCYKVMINVGLLLSFWSEMIMVHGKLVSDGLSSWSAELSSVILREVSFFFAPEPIILRNEPVTVQSTLIHDRKVRSQILMQSGDIEVNPGPPSDEQVRAGTDHSRYLVGHAQGDRGGASQSYQPASHTHLGSGARPKDYNHSSLQSRRGMARGAHEGSTRPYHARNFDQSQGPWPR